MAVQITFERGLKIWWSYSWRAFVLVFPVMTLTLYLLGGDAPPGAAAAGATPDPMSDAQGGNPLLVVILVAVISVLQVQALRWMLKTRWSDFRLEAVSSSPAASSEHTE